MPQAKTNKARAAAKEPGPKMDVQQSRSVNFVSAYANHVAVAMTIFEFSVVFSQAFRRDAGTGVDLEHQCRVSMSPIQAKLLAIYLNHSLVEFENRFGNIPVPKDQLPDAPDAVTPKDG